MWEWESYTVKNYRLNVNLISSRTVHPSDSIFWPCGNPKGENILCHITNQDMNNNDLSLWFDIMMPWTIVISASLCLWPQTRIYSVLNRVLHPIAASMHLNSKNWEASISCTKEEKWSNICAAGRKNAFKWKTFQLFSESARKDSMWITIDDAKVYDQW